MALRTSLSTGLALTLFRALGRIAPRLAAVFFALMSAFVIWNCCRQLERDRVIRDELHTAAAQVETISERLGRQPSKNELDCVNLERVTYYRLVDWPDRLRSLGARDDDDYMISVQRSDWRDYYYSWSGEDTCDSKAWVVLLVVGVPLAVVSIWLLWLSRRRSRPTA